MSATNGKTLGFEVHVLRGGRWQIHATYPANQRRIATRDAKSLDSISNISGARVVRQYQDPSHVAPTDQVIFVSPKLERRERAAKSAMSEDVASGATPTDADNGLAADAAASAEMAEGQGLNRGGGGAKAQRKKGSAAQLLVRLAIVSVVSLVIASGVVGVMSILLTRITVLAELTAGAIRDNVLFLTFIGAFLLSAFPLAIKFVGRLSAHTGTPKPRRRSKRKTVRRRGHVGPAPHAPEIEAMKAQSAGIEARPDEPDGLPIKAVRDMAKSLSAVLADGISLKPKTYLGNLPSLGDLLSGPTKTAYQDLRRFIDKSRKEATESQAPLDNVTRFGISLFIAGAVEALSGRRALPDRESAKILAQSIQGLGFTRNQATGFAKKHDQYLLADPRYLKMYQQGRQAMTLELKTDPGAKKMLDDALATWNMPHDANFQGQGRTVAVLFTDIVNSTEITAALGDQAAQEIVRYHNRIVRDALTVFHGREVKHTGDGIMASFENASDAIEGAVAVQEAIHEQSDEEPTGLLKVKIGINVGEAIMEDDDLFGSTVQVAARIVDQAQAGEILISDVTKRLSAGKKLPSRDRGAIPMKGVPDPVILHEVLWGAAAEAFLEAAEAAATEAPSNVTKAGPPNGDNPATTGAATTMPKDTTPAPS